MANYQNMYKTLFNAITDAINILQHAQQSAEGQYIAADEQLINVLASNNDDDES